MPGDTFTACFTEASLREFHRRIREEALEEAREEQRELREAAKNGWRAMCDAEAVIRTIDPESAAEDEQFRQLCTALSDIALSLFTILREPPQEYASALRSLKGAAAIGEGK
jgi:hypothetical protein